MSLNVMSTLAVKVAMERGLLPGFTAATGIVPELTWNPTTVIMQRIEAGGRADAIVLIDQAMERLVAAGIVRPESVRPIATAQIGVGVAAGAPKPAIGTLAEFTAAIRAARAVAYSRSGASGIHFAGVIEKLGVAEEINSRAVVIPEGFTAKEVAAGRADLAIQQISELMEVENIDIAGPLPAEIQVDTDFSVAVFTDAANPDDAARLLDYLTSAEAGAAYAAGGLKSRLPGAV